VIGVAARIAHHVLFQLMSRTGRRTRRAVDGAIALVGLALLVVGAVSLHRRADDVFSGRYLSPAALGAGTILLEYAAETATRYGLAVGGWSRVLGSTKTVRRLLLVALALIAAFWATANVAQQHGMDAARAVELSLPVRQQAIVYARERLQISGPGVAMVRLDAKNSQFGFRYNGLRTLAHSGGRWFLLPAGWTHDNGAAVILLPDSAKDVRVDLVP
jgi:hypothetical protein